MKSKIKKGWCKSNDYLDMNSQHKPARKIPDLPAKKKTNVPLDPHTKSFLKVLRMVPWFFLLGGYQIFFYFF